MQKLVRDYLNELNKKQKKRRKAGIAAVMLVVLVVGAVMGTLTQYGVAMTGDAKCGLEEHQHSETCYTRELICGLEESEGHTHTDACRYPAELVCGLEESAGEDGTEGHTHSDACYAAPEGWACGVEESEGHIHTDDCYSSRLSCDIEEHTHSDACYGDPDNDPNADVENADVWNAQYADAEWTDSWGDNLAAAARVQLGYRESEKNYTEAEDGSHKGYTRYGQFVNDVYRDYWDTAFVNFCVYYAGLTDTNLFPNEMNGARSERYPEGLTDAAKWQEEFLKINEQNEKALACLAEAAGYEPKAGDLVFFEKDKADGSQEKENRMGVVSSYNNENGELKVIEGDSDGEVKENTYQTGDADSHIVRYLDITALENGYKTGWADAEENQTEEPVETEDGNQSEIPVKTEDGSQTETPTQTEDGSQTETPTQTEQEIVEMPTEYTECLTVADLDELKEQDAGSATENLPGNDLETEGEKETDIEDDKVENGNWSFDAYYVNQDDNYDIVKTSNFNLKYQMEFHTSKNFKANEIAIRVKKDLLSKRDKTPISPDQVAVPQVQISETETEEGTVTTEVPIRSSHMPFNYRVKVIDGTEYLEFFNYEEIKAGTNVAWQILYKNLKIMEIEDETKWELKPEIIFWPLNGDTQEPVYDAENPEVKKSVTPLKGEIDSSVKMTSVTKREYYENGKQYTPELYTASQVRAYTEKLSETSENEFFPEGELNKEYYYTVWEVTTKGTATQPWKLQVEETPGFEGKIVGYKDNHNALRGYDDPIDAGAALTSGVAIAKNEKSSWSSRFYVVVAYPKEGQNITPGTTKVDNEIKITAIPCDGKDQPEEKTSRAEYIYKDFTWTYPSDAIGVRKKTDDEKEDFAGWLEVYSRAKEAGSDYGDIPFTSRGKFRGYEQTHITTGEELGQYKKDTYYKLITADDIMYAVKDGEYSMLDAEDYYYSSVEITQRDTGYDIWEDADTVPEENGDLNAQDLIVYAQFGGTGENKDEWVEVGRVPWNSEGVIQYSFTPDQIARQPYRVKAEHVSTNYLTTCEIRVKVRMKHDSPVMDKLMRDYEKGKQFALTFEDLSGVIGQVKGKDGTYSLVETDKRVDDTGNYNYEGRDDLLEKTRRLYKELAEADSSDKKDFPMYRDNALQTVKGLEAHAESNKKLTSLTNDVGNRRGQVVYSLTAQDGYDIYSEQAVTELKRQGMESPGRQNVVFYDLLPEGMTFDPSYAVTAGRITNFDKKKNYAKQPGLWDDAQVTVTWETVDNYRGTSRMMVIFHIAYEGQDAAVYSNKYWAEGWGVSFRAYYDWGDTELVQKGTNISAFMPDTSDPKYGDSKYPLCGTADEVAKDDGIIVPNTDSEFEEIYSDFGKDIDENPNNNNIRNVLYAQNSESEDIALNFQSSITKQVRADADEYSSYRASAVVEENGFYTYDIRVSTGSGSSSKLSDLIIYDHLENAAGDRGTDDRDPNNGFENANWQGTLESVTTSGLEKLGVKPVVYYSEKRDAVMPQAKDLKNADGTLMSLDEYRGSDDTQVWYSKEDFLNKTGSDNKEFSLADAKSIAVDLRKMTDGTSFVLAEESSVSFRVKMKAPEIGTEGQDGYAYNCPAYASTVGSGTAAMDNDIRFGDSTKVSRKKAAGLEVIKKFGSEVPDSVKDTTFEFILTDKRQKDPKPFSYQVYKLYRKDADGNWKEQQGQYATDGDGLLTLRADEKAEFEKVADLQNIEVKEKENIFWKSETEDQSADETEGNRVVTVTNAYRPVLYVRKQLEGVPQELRSAPDWESSYPFTFQVQAELEGDSATPAERDFYYVKEVRTDGGVPRIDTSKGKNGKGKLEEDGTFTIYQGDIIALFPGDAGTKYEVKEVSNPATDNDWICRKDTVSGTLPVKGASAVIQNFYRWKELYLTKLITHMSGPCNEEFTFQIQKVVEKDGTKVVVNLTQAEINELELATGTRRRGEFWEDTDPSDYFPSTNMPMMEYRQDGTEENTVSRLLPFATVGDAMVTPGNIAGKATTGNVSIDAEGKFSFQYRMNRVLRIKNLEAGTTYRITELPRDGSLYLPVESSVEVTMPFYGDDKEVSITNDYQMRPLKITKTVVSSEGQIEDHTEFTMKVLVNNEPLKGKQYVILDSNNNAASEIYTISDDGTVRLKDGQTVFIIDAGRLGDTFEVTEEATEGYLQIAPAGSAEGTFAGEGPEAAFINAKQSDGSKNLYISKIYENGTPYGGTFGPAAIVNGYIDQLKENNKSDADGSEPQDGVGKGSVEVTLTIGGEVFSGPADVTVINQLDSTVSKKTWSGSTFQLDPWSMVIVPVQGDGDVSYTLAESGEDQHRIVSYRYNEEDKWLEISQADPKNDRPVTGTVKDNPIAVITNQIKSVNGSKVAKQMTEKSSPVSEGAELVWRVEEYNGTAWVAAEDVSYITLDGEWQDDKKSMSELAPTCDRILKTGPDGRIVLTKGKNNRWPIVYFDIDVGVGSYDSYMGAYRVVEVIEESDEAWGMLKGYIEFNGELMRPNGISKSEFNGFVNSNEIAPIEIAKEMAETSDATFTMILKQVLSLKGGTDLEDIQEEDITASEGRAGIPYTVYDTSTGEVVGYKETGKNGEIQLKAGQFARLNLSNTLWTVSEEVGHTYKLTDLTPESTQKMKRLNPNLMLINCQNPVKYTVTYMWGLSENENDKVYMTYQCKEGTRTPIPADPKREGYDFMGWAPAVAEKVTDNITYMATWQKEKVYTVVYNDGVPGSPVVFPDAGHEGMKIGDSVPLYSDTLSRDGYIFAGWYPSMDGNSVEGYWDGSSARTLTKEDANRAKSEDGQWKIYYYARWVKKGSKVYYHTNVDEGEIVKSVSVAYRYGKHTVQNGQYGNTGEQVATPETLLGWSTKPGGTTEGDVEYKIGETYFFGENTDLYPVVKQQ